MNKELIKQARQANLANFLLQQGVDLKREGRRYKSKEHSSLIFTDNAYYWNSRNEHGNAIDYLTKHMNYTFQEAIAALTGIKNSTPTDGESVECFRITNVITSNQLQRTIAYLNKTRFIDIDIITSLIKNKDLLQEQTTNNAIFVIKNEHDEPVGAELQGTLSHLRFKGIATGSAYGYGFNIKDTNKPTKAFFFESAIDLLSFYELYRHRLESFILVSMGGLKVNVIETTLEAYKTILELFIATDNDQASTTFKQSLTMQFKDVLPRTPYKDWNEQLLDRKKKIGSVASN